MRYVGWVLGCGFEVGEENMDNGEGCMDVSLVGDRVGLYKIWKVRTLALCCTLSCTMGKVVAASSSVMAGAIGQVSDLEPEADLTNPERICDILRRRKMRVRGLKSK